jgi:hypothetical protein
MRLLFGMILGALLTIGAVFVADSRTSGDGASSTTPRPIVNWDVAEEQFHALVIYAREEWGKLAPEK